MTPQQKLDGATDPTWFGLFWLWMAGVAIAMGLVLLGPRGVTIGLAIWAFGWIPIGAWHARYARLVATCQRAQKCTSRADVV